jgi:hypothetical protein
MTTASPIYATATFPAPGYRAAEPSARPQAAAEPAAGGRTGSAAGVPRLPGQEGLGQDGGSGRSLTPGGAFTLAVAIGLALDEIIRPGFEEFGAAGTGEADEDDAAGPNGLTEEEEKVVRELKAQDAEIRRHEAAHAAVGGPYAGAPTYVYQRGPDGKQYAVGGAVSIDTAPIEGDPAATIQKAQVVKAAALAPAEPSAQDRKVAAQADAMLRQAQAELAAQRRDERLEGAGETDESGEVGVVPPDPVAPDLVVVDEADEEADGFAASPAGAFALGAFGEAAAAYRGPISAPPALSIAV